MKPMIGVATIYLLLAASAHATPAWSVETGGLIGGADGVGGVGGSIGAGQRLFHSGAASVWAHETLTATSLFGPLLFGHGSGAAFRGSAGIELQAATSPGGPTYFLFGLEAGYLQVDYEGVDDAFFGGSTPVSIHDRGPIGAFRIGIHFGSQSVGIEPVLELIPRSGQPTAGDLGLTLVFAW